MRFVMFRIPKPKKFSYKPRYFDEEKEKLQQRKAELGYESDLSRQESIRFQMRKRWRGGEKDTDHIRLSKIISYGFYAFVIIGGVYAIFFTDLVDKIVALFGVGQ